MDKAGRFVAIGSGIKGQGEYSTPGEPPNCARNAGP